MNQDKPANVAGKKRERETETGRRSGQENEHKQCTIFNERSWSSSRDALPQSSLSFVAKYLHVSVNWLPPTTAFDTALPDPSHSDLDPSNYPTGPARSPYERLVAQ